MIQFEDFIEDAKEKGLVHFTHTDGDGLACYAIPMVYSMHEEKLSIEHILEGNVNEMNQRIQEFLKENPGDERAILITDISVNEETCAELDKVVSDRKIAIIDHHAMHNRKSERDYILLDGKADGACTLLYEWFNFDSIGEYLYDQLKHDVYAAGRYDSFKWTDKNCEENDVTETTLTAYISTFGVEDTINMLESSIDKGASFYHGRTHKYVNMCYMKNLDKDLKILDKNTIIVEDDYTDKSGKTYHYRYGVTSGYQYISYNAKRYLESLEESDDENVLKLDFLVGLRPTSTNVELRSIRDDVNVGLIAKHFGGDGHAKAAGFSLPKEKIISLYTLYLEELLK